MMLKKTTGTDFLLTQHNKKIASISPPRIYSTLGPC